jgi:CBS domain-containing protein
LPLDGGQVLKAAIWKATQSRVKGIRWAARTGQFLGWGAIGLGVLAYLAQPSLDLIWIVLVGGFAVRNAAAYGRVADLEDNLSQLTAADAVSREFRVIDATQMVRSFAEEYLLQTERAPAYFASSDGRYRGLITLEAVQQLERGTWDTTSLREIAQPLDSIPTVREATPLAEVINTLEQDSLKRITVLTPADAVAGVIDRGDIVRAMAQNMNLPISEALIQRIKDDGEYPPGLKLASLAKALTE